MSMTAPKVKIADLVELNPKPTNSTAPDDTVSFVSMPAVDAETACIPAYGERKHSEVSKGYTPFNDGDILVAKITPCFENGKLAQAQIAHSIGFGSTEFHVLRAQKGRISARYLLHFLRQKWIRLDGERKMTGSAGQRRVPANFLTNLSVPLPPLSEQQRIAAALDQVEVLRAKRREALARLDELTQSIFLDMFGDPEENAEGWPTLRLADVLTKPLRNGLSPSKGGDVSASVLTLSAITGNEFQADALKTGQFLTHPPSDQEVDDSDLLICRGNGNISRVGKAYFPKSRMPGVLFPDIMVAARISPNLVCKEFLQQVWNSRAVRRQIEAAARTTNGTFKINQQVLQRISFLSPAFELQREFARHVEAIERLKASHRAHLAELDELFASLQQRAFRGEL